MEEGFGILDAWILAENKVVTYKLLSRLLQCHVNLAKQILQAWRQNNPNSHATYVICGISTPISTQDTQSSNQPSSMPSEKDEDRSTEKLKLLPRSSSVRNIVLVAEEDLEAMKAKYDSVTSCHVYSVEPARLTDYGIVVDVGNDIREAMRGRSTKIIDLANTYGTTFNARVNIADETRTKGAPIHEVKPIMKVEPISEPVVKPQPISRESSSTSQSKQSLEKPVVAQKLKRNATSSLASAFAKTQKPKPKVKPAADASEAVSTSTEEVAKEESKVDAKSNKKDIKPTIQSKKQMEEEAALRDMMMMDDADEAEEAEAVVVPVVEPVAESAEAEMLDASDWSASDTEMKEAIPPAAPVVVPAITKKRTRKKVKKQVHTKDAKGYMVTKEEWEWISCDEEEAASTSTLSRQSSIKSEVTKSAAPSKKKAPGQAGIASYFSKR